jgi:hypothetical protein
MDATKTLVGNLWQIGQDANGRGMDTNGRTLQCSGLLMPWLVGNSTVMIAHDGVNNKVWFGMNGFMTWDVNSSFSSSLYLSSLVTGLGIARNGGGTNWIGGTATAFGTAASGGSSGGYGSGKLVFEITVSSGTPGSDVILGACTSAVNFVSNLTYPGNDTTKGFGYQSNGSTYGMGGITMPSMAVGDVITFAIDYTHGKGWVANNSNGKWNNDVLANQDPANNIGGFTLPSGTLLPSAAFFSSSKVVTLNAGSSGFTAAPSGFTAYEPGTFKWNNDVLANQDPANNIGGISTSGIATSTIYPAWSIYNNTNPSTANFDASTFVFTVPVGFSGWDGNQFHAAANSPGDAFVMCG